MGYGSCRRRRYVAHPPGRVVRRAANPWDRYYHQHAAPWRGAREVEPLRPWLGDGRILELGVGNGKTWRPLREAGFDVVGLDVAFHALRRLGDGVLADAAMLPFGAGSFAAVLDLHCSGHLLESGRITNHAEVQRVLEPGGHVVCERLGRSDLRAGKGDEVEPWTRRLQDGRTTHFSHEASLRAEWEDAGFEIVASMTECRRVRYRDQHVVREHVRVVARR